MCYCTWNIELFEVWKCLLTIFFCPCVSNVLKNNSSMLLTFKITKVQLWKNLYFLSSIALLLNIIIFKMTDQRLIWTVFLNKLLHFRNINTIFTFFYGSTVVFLNLTVSCAYLKDNISHYQVKFKKWCFTLEATKSSPIVQIHGNDKRFQKR